MLSSNQVSAAVMTSASGKKWRPLSTFSVQGTGGSPTGPDPENKVGDQDIRSLGKPVSSGLQVSVSRGIVVQEQDPICDLSAAVFLPSKCPSIAPAETSNTPR